MNRGEVGVRSWGEIMRQFLFCREKKKNAHLGEMNKDLEPHSFKAFPTQTSQTGLENKEPTAVYNGNPHNLDLGVPPELPQAFGGHAL